MTEYNKDLLNEIARAAHGKDFTEINIAFREPIMKIAKWHVRQSKIARMDELQMFDFGSGFQLKRQADEKVRLIEKSLDDMNVSPKL